MNMRPVFQTALFWAVAISCGTHPPMSRDNRTPVDDSVQKPRDGSQQNQGDRSSGDSQTNPGGGEDSNSTTPPPNTDQPPTSGQDSDNSQQDEDNNNPLPPDNQEDNSASCQQSFDFETTKAGGYDVYLPKSDQPVPLIVFNMGTGVSNGSIYRNFYPIFAKHGIAVVVNPDSMSMNKPSTMDALSAAHEKFSARLLDNLGATGHSQGGAAAWQNSGKTTPSGGTITTVVGLEPGTFGFLQAPAETKYLNLIGGRDQLGAGTNGMAYFNMVNKENRFTATLTNADHLNMMNDPTAYKPFGKASALWFMCHLKEMKCACNTFKANNCNSLTKTTNGGKWDSCRRD